MGRKNKNTVDYFPHFVNHGKTIYILESKFGNDGYSSWFKLLEVLGSNENHYFDCRETDDWEYLIAKLKVSENIVNDILNTCAKLGAIHEELWENKIIWSWNFIDGLESVYKRRENTCLHFNDLCKHLSVKCKHKYDSCGIIVNRKPQSRVEESKEKKSRAENSKVIIPFGEDEFIAVWEFWKEYKKEQHGFTYKQIGEQGALGKLVELSGGKVETAMLIIKQSIQNSWKGLFELKGEFKTQEYDRGKIFDDLAKS